MRSTGPILAVGAITLFNSVVVHSEPMSAAARIAVGTGIAAGGLALLEHLSEPLAVGIAWVALVTLLFVRVAPAVPAPMETIAQWYKNG